MEISKGGGKEGEFVFRGDGQTLFSPDDLSRSAFVLSKNPHLTPRDSLVDIPDLALPDDLQLSPQFPLLLDLFTAVRLETRVDLAFGGRVG